MFISDLEISDLAELEKDAQFPLPNLALPQYILKGSVLDDDELLGSFWVKLTTETSMILRSNACELTKAKAIKTIINYVRKELLLMGHDDSHLFIRNDPEYVSFLKKNFAFRDVLGAALFRDLKERGRHG